MGYRARKLAAALVAAAAVVLGQPLVATLHSVDKGAGALHHGDLGIAEVGACHRYGPLSRNGIGYHWSCEVDVRLAGGRVEHVVVDRSIVTPADAGRQLRFDESCDDDGCVYGRASNGFWSATKFLLHAVLETVWRALAVGCAFVVVWSLAGVVVGARRLERVRAWVRRREGPPEMASPAAAITASRSPEPGLTVTFVCPDAALYRAARPTLRINGGDPVVADWGVRTFPVRPGWRHLDVVVVTRSVALHTSQARISVWVGRRRGAVVTYRPPDIGPPAPSTYLAPQGTV